MIGPESERAGTIRYGMAAAAVAQGPCRGRLFIHKGFGVVTAAHYAPGAYVLAWPGRTGALPIEGGVAVAFHREIAAAADPDAKRAELEERLREARSPFPRAESFAVHELIDPRETRPVLCDWIEWIQPLLDTLTGLTQFPIRP